MSSTKSGHNGSRGTFGLVGESIICFAGEDWWYHHPHSKNHILKRLATENRVLFVNSITMGLPSVSNPDFFLKIWKKMGSLLRWLRKSPEGLFVLTPVSLPFYESPLLRKVNRVLLRVQLRIVIFLCNMRDPVIWVAIPSAVDTVESLNPKLVIYQVSDKYDANEDSALSQSVIRDMERRLKHMAAIVLYSGRKLFEEANEPHRYFLEQAVDFEHFASTREVAPEMLSIPRPVLGYFGYLDYVMDVALIEEVCKLRPNWHWVLIGRRSNVVQISSANVHFMGSKPYSELPRYLKNIDVCVLPWRQDHVFTSYGSAIKVREYLATGKPVVISPLYEYLHTPGIRIYRSTQEFIALVESALRDDTPFDREKRQSVVRNCTWDMRAREVGELITGLLRQRSLPGKSALSAIPSLPADQIEPNLD